MIMQTRAGERTRGTFPTNGTTAHATAHATARTLAVPACRLAVAMLAVLAIGCSGDVDPLVEAIEVRDLRLGSLEIERPFGTQTPLYINAGERLSFGLSGLDVDGRTIDDLGAEGRNWSVSDGSVASIDGNGELVGRADGTAMVGVRIGDIVAQEFEVRVATAAFRSIERIVGADQLDPCIPELYTAIGTFADEDQSERLLRGVGWTSDAAGTERTVSEDGSVLELSASDAGGTVVLAATVEQASLSREIAVTTSLTALELERTDQSSSVQSFTADVGDTLELSAIGRYTGADGVTRERDVTDSVVWETVDGGEFATVSDDPDTRGRVTTTSVGTARVLARCGEILSDTRQVVVSESTTDDADGDGLSFDGITNGDGDGDGGSLTVALSIGQLSLNVSTGSTYDEDDDVTDLADWSLVNPGEFPIGTIDNDGLDRGIFRPLNVGTGQIRVDYLGRTVTLTITVNAN